MDRLEELADEEHALRHQVAEADMALDQADMTYRAARAKRREELRAHMEYGEAARCTLKELDGRVDMEVAAATGALAELWLAWETAKVGRNKLIADADRAKSRYFDHKERTKFGGGYNASVS